MTNDFCQCPKTIKEQGRACALCRLKQMTDQAWIDHFIEMEEYLNGMPYGDTTED